MFSPNRITPPTSPRCTLPRSAAVGVVPDIATMSFWPMSCAVVGDAARSAGTRVPGRAAAAARTRSAIPTVVTLMRTPNPRCVPAGASRAVRSCLRSIDAGEASCESRPATGWGYFLEVNEVRGGRRSSARKGVAEHDRVSDEFARDEVRPPRAHPDGKSESADLLRAAVDEVEHRGTRDVRHDRLARGGVLETNEEVAGDDHAHGISIVVEERHRFLAV